MACDISPVQQLAWLQYVLECFLLLPSLSSSCRHARYQKSGISVGYLQRQPHVHAARISSPMACSFSFCAEDVDLDHARASTHSSSYSRSARSHGEIKGAGKVVVMCDGGTALRLQAVWLEFAVDAGIIRRVYERLYALLYSHAADSTKRFHKVCNNGE